MAPGIRAFLVHRSEPGLRIVCLHMDIDAFVATHRGEWDRLETLIGRQRGLSGAEADELVDLYQRVATHLSVVRSSAPDPALVGRLSTLVAKARGVVTGTRSASTREFGRFFTVRFPAAVYRARWWWMSTPECLLVVSLALGWWVAVNPDVQASHRNPGRDQGPGAAAVPVVLQLEPRGRLRVPGVDEQRVGRRVVVSHPAGCWVCRSRGCSSQNAANVGVEGGLMAAHGRLDLFFGLILPHGLLELTAVFIAAGVGMRLGWTIIAPGERPRGEAMATEGRAAVGVAMGLVCVLLVSGVIEAFVTPSPLPTVARVGIGFAVWAGFLAYVFVLGGRAVRAGETGDIDAASAGDLLPTAG